MSEKENPEECGFCGYETKVLKYYDDKWLCEVCAESVPGTVIDGRGHSVDVARQISYLANKILDALRKT